MHVHNSKIIVLDYNTTPSLKKMAVCSSAGNGYFFVVALVAGTVFVSSQGE